MAHGQGEARPVLQYRWRVESSKDEFAAVYYGLRNFPKHLNGRIKLSPEVAALVRGLDGNSSLDQVMSGASGAAAAELQALMEQGVLVDAAAKRQPATSGSYQTCVRCVNNDLVLPGLEFDEQGVCAFCQCYENVPDSGPLHGGTVTEKELLATAKTNPGRYDAMVLYTGGKDSSFLLWYLAKKLGLRVLAATWDLPFTNESSRRNMRAARYKLPNVEFVERSLPWDLIQKTSRELFDQVGLPCICPVISAVLFYPLAAWEKIPYVMDGVEAAQLIILGKIMNLPATTKSKELSDRELTIRQITRYLKPWLGSSDPWDEYLRLVKEKLVRVYEPLEQVLATTAPEALPLVKRLSSEDVYGTWDNVRSVIERELDWRMPAGQEGLLHTSCDIERVKDFSQYRRFVDMRTRSMPQSIIEISAAVHFRQITREQGLRELAERGYHDPPAELEALIKKLDIDPSGIDSLPGELPCICRGCHY